MDADLSDRGRERPERRWPAFYEELFTECRRYGIEPVVTLCHFDVPEALIRKYGAWADRRLIALYENTLPPCLTATGIW